MYCTSAFLIFTPLISFFTLMWNTINITSSVISVAIPAPSAPYFGINTKFNTISSKAAPTSTYM